MWKNCIENAQEYITLHDCVVNSAEAFDDVLSLTFDDGFWILADTKYNPCGETARTDKSKINFTEFDEQLSVFYLFKRHYIFGKRLCTTRKKVELKEVYKKINKGEWKIEFNEKYNGVHQVLFFGGVTTKKKIWAYEFQMVIDCDKIKYYWNNIRPDRKW